MAAFIDAASRADVDALLAVEHRCSTHPWTERHFVAEMDEMRRTALGRRAEIVAQTRAEAETAVAEALRQLDAESRAARRRLEADAETLGAAAADRILGRRAS